MFMAEGLEAGPGVRIANDLACLDAKAGVLRGQLLEEGFRGGAAGTAVPREDFDRQESIEPLLLVFLIESDLQPSGCECGWRGWPFHPEMLSEAFQSLQGLRVGDVTNDKLHAAALATSWR